MKGWLGEYWYLVIGIVGGILVLALHAYAKRHPETQFASQWERLRYAVYAAAPIGGILMLLDVALQVWAPQYSLFEYFFTPYFGLVIVAVSWLVAPYLRRIIPIERGRP